MTPSRFPTWFLGGLLMLVTVALYWRAMQCGFVDYDDPDYVTANPHVQAGLNWENVKWAFCNPVVANWHPLTMMSHMMDCQLFGMNAWGHHLTSVLLHALNAALVFVLLRELTGTTWRSLMVAGLFAVHPLRVESVAWVAERKDVLSGCFGLLTLIFYERFAHKQSRAAGRKPRVGILSMFGNASAAYDYSLALLCLTVGLMSKPMLVTMPFVLLLLDYWPLARFKAGNMGRLFMEKIPFFAVAAAAAIVTFMVQQRSGAVDEVLPLGARTGNALISYWRYLGKMAWPVNLAVPYPHPEYWPLAEVLLAGGLLAGASLLFWMQRRQYPFLLVGWLWYCGMLTPVIGLVQVGAQAMADRYTYLPSVGVLVMVIWGVEEFSRRWRQRVTILSVAGAAAVIVFMVLTRQQIAYWQDSETLYRHALAVTKNNHFAHCNLGIVLYQEGHIGEAIREYKEAIRLQPDDTGIHNNLGLAFEKEGELDEAISQFQEAIRLKPSYATAHFNLGIAFYKQDRTSEAIGQYQTAIRLDSNHAEFHNNLGAAFYKQGQIGEAISQLQEAVRLDPDYASARDNLVKAQSKINRPASH